MRCTDWGCARKRGGMGGVEVGRRVLEELEVACDCPLTIGAARRRRKGRRLGKKPGSPIRALPLRVLEVACRPGAHEARPAA